VAQKANSAGIFGMSMTPERWQQIKVVLQDALELPKQQRSAFLAKASLGDPALRQEVESFLALGDEEVSTGILESSASRVALTPGTMLGEYEVLSLLGVGGMGEVYRARDPRLRREVAIKVLPSLVSNEPDRLRRFEQEAQAAAALNHPNILAVFQMGTYEGAPYLVSELLEGRTLREHLLRGPMPVRKAIDYSVQIARGLAAAHEKGVVHRDLKPENIFVTNDGRAKILDFGLAKLTERHWALDSNVATATEGTEPGVVMGTVGYMSPEQVSGRPADHRADIFALGAIMYDALTGKRAFQKPTAPETMSAILNEDPPTASQFVPTIPPALQKVVRRCLDKNPAQRFQSASDLAFALEALSDSGGSSAIVLSQPRKLFKNGKQLWKILVPTTVLVIALGGMFEWFTRPLPPPRVLNATQITHDGFTKAGALNDESRLYIVEIMGSNRFLVQVSSTGGDSSVIPTPFTNIVLADISPDHSRLLVADAVRTENEGQAWIFPLPTGAPERLGDIVLRCDPWSGASAAWSPDGRRLAFAKDSSIYMADADGTNVRQLSTLSGSAAQMHFSPDGTRLRFTLQTPHSSSTSIWEVRADGADLHPVFPGWHSPASEVAGLWSPDGRYYFFENATSANDVSIWAIREATASFHRRSPPVQLTTGPLNAALAGISPDGKRLFAGTWSIQSELVRYDMHAHQFTPFLGGIPASELDFSRDGKWVAYVSSIGSTLWRSRVDGSDRLQLTSTSTYAFLPRWSPDGTQIAYSDLRSGLPKIFLISAHGGTPEAMLSDNQAQLDPSWSPDGKEIVFGGAPWIGAANEKIAIRILDVMSRRVSTIPNSENLFAPRWSPDGKYLSALSVDAKKLLLWDFKTMKWVDWVNESWPIEYPTWSQDGRYIYYENTSTNSPSYRRVRVGDTRPEALIALKNLRRHIFSAVANLGPWSGVAPDGSPLFVRDLSMDEIYSLELELP
jgi:serine/threonine protein kinase/Tol biopolymer transport system component